MAVTRKQLYREFHQRKSIVGLARKYGVAVRYVEDAIRQYWRRKVGKD